MQETAFCNEKRPVKKFDYSFMEKYIKDYSFIRDKMIK